MNINNFWSCLIVIVISIYLVKVTETACQTGYTDIQGDCYSFYSSDSLNYADAQAMCEEDGGHLAYIKDCNKFTYIIRHIRSRNLTPQGTGFWIGATDEEEEGDWVWGNGFAARMGVPFWGTSGENWDSEPNGGPSENCAQLSSSDQFYFHDEDCQGTGSPLCQVDPLQETNVYSESHPETNGLEEEKRYNAEDALCPDGFIYIGKSCFFFGTDRLKVTAVDALSFCKTIDATLPVLTDCVEFQQLVEEIEKNYPLGPNESYWVGGSDYGGEGTWIWGDFTSMELGPPLWGSTNGVAEPSGRLNQNCAILYKNDRYYIHDGECNKGTKILCKTSATVSAKKSGYP